MDLCDTDPLLEGVEWGEGVGQQHQHGVGCPHQDKIVPHPRGEEAEPLLGRLGDHLFCGEVHLGSRITMAWP